MKKNTWKSVRWLLWDYGGFCREWKEKPGGDYLQLHKAKKAAELKDLLLFHAINFQPIHRYEASEGAWGTEGQDTRCVRWPEESQVPPGSPSRDRLSQSQKDLIYQTSPPNPNLPLYSPETSRGPSWVCNPETRCRQKYQKWKGARGGNVRDRPKPGQKEPIWSLQQR